jgi:hypothetical protein
MRFLLVLIIVMLIALALWSEPPTPAVEDTFIGPQIKIMNNMENFEQDYLDGLDKKKEEIEDQAGGGK